MGHGLKIQLHLMIKQCRGFPGGSVAKKSLANAGDMGSIPGSGRSPGEGKQQSTSVLLPGKSHGQKSLVGYSPWAHKELDITEVTWHTHSTM